MSTSIAFGEDNFDWQLYQQVRPRYPQSLWKRILDYHCTHNSDGILDHAHDVGSGHGIVAKEFLLANARHVFVSDPATYNINAARRYLSREADEGRVTFEQCGAETQYLPDASMDMVTAFECVHWMDIDKAVPSIAATLKSGGTLAVVFYFPQPFIWNNPRIGLAWQRIWDKFIERLQTSDNWESLRGKVRQSAEGLDSTLPLPRDLFQQNAQRIRINADLLSEGSHGSPDHPFYFNGLGAMGGVPSHVVEGEQCTSITDEDWMQSVDLDWLKGIMQAMQPALPEYLSMREFADIDRELQLEGGRTSVFWVVDLVLATKK